MLIICFALLASIYTSQGSDVFSHQLANALRRMLLKSIIKFNKDLMTKYSRAPMFEFEFATPSFELTDQPPQFEPLFAEL